MVFNMKKLFIILICVCLVVPFLVVSSSAASSNGLSDPVVLEYFRGVIDKLPVGTEYFVFSDSSSSCCLIYSVDLSLSDDQLIGNDVTQIIYDYSSEEPVITSNFFVNYNLNFNPNILIYSSLGVYPSLVSVDSNVLRYILYVLILFLLLFVAFKFFRNRRSYINL